ncbi:SMEK domain-containing protein [Pseudobutyrivibrio ruminis]|uniref:SMEK domain-containing protein n=1 Tax=Pseudobutyrivibrio ruminis TaxID=46206 RepID=A0A2G3DTN2_9FIRM|nr:SMEK domain-containing protein [Pseudobutyrivibrio ruminis]PHU34240.1 hypothetical protein CSX01_11785 [Pseudobutyrivibrio ruminis]
MINREVYIKNITDNLAILRSQVEIRNAINLYDINIIAEDFYPGLLNIIFNRDYKNANYLEKNAAGIDLYDEKNRLAIQVTSDNTSEKVKHTIDEFIKNESYKKYDKLQVLILTHKKDYRTTFNTNGLFTFDKTTDIFDVEDLMVQIRSMNISKLKEINDFLQKELYSKYEKASRTEASEVDTIIDLIEYISMNRKIIEAKDVVVDPEYKIHNRFREFANRITSQYLDLYGIYKTALDEVENERGDAAQDIITTMFLQDISIEFLEKANDNPVKALDELTAYFNEKLSANGKTYDRAAIKFYLVDKMIKCSVFPNERSEYDAS